MRQKAIIIRLGLFLGSQIRLYPAMRISKANSKSIICPAERDSVQSMIGIIINYFLQLSLKSIKIKYYLLIL